MLLHGVNNAMAVKYPVLLNDFRPDPELVIRTSGELRLSNYLLWQVAYSEFYVTDTYWPDFDRWGLVDAILAYQGRDRRFGGLSKTEEA